MKTFCIAIAALSGLTATAAIASPSGAKADTPALALAATAGEPAQADTRRYCVVDTPTGSHIRTKTCRTRAQWEADGVDIMAAAK